MLECIRDKDENIVGVVDFWIVNPDGTLNDKGDLVWINDFYVNPAYRNNGMLGEFIDKIIKRVPQAKAAYFRRTETDKRKEYIKLYMKKDWLYFMKRSLAEKEE